MLRNISSNLTKVSMRITLKKVDGANVNLCFKKLPKDRVEEYVEFQMNYFVKAELTHQISGITDNKESMAEYRQYLTSMLRDPSCHSIICFPEHNIDVPSDIIGGHTLKLLKRGDSDSDTLPVEAKTKELNKYFQILRMWNNLFPIPDLMRQYNLPYFLDDRGVAVRPDYSRYGIAMIFAVLSRLTCKAHGAPMTGAWTSSMGGQKAAKKAGWETLYEISREELEKLLNINLTIRNTPPTFKYMIAKI